MPSPVDPVQAAKAAIERSPSIPSLAALAAGAGVPPSRLLRLFKEQVGLTPRSYAESMRARRAAPPASSGGPVLRTLLAETGLGRMLIAATPRGVCFLGFGEPDDALIGDLRLRVPNATHAPADHAVWAALDRVQAYLRAPYRGLILPLDLMGTPFQRAVWQALVDIPPGQTRTYAEIAARAGAAGAARAAGRACAVNPVSLAVPCHRAVGSHGDLTGYRWGLDHKRTLIVAERASP